jgi:cold shock CspA family protein
MISERFTGTCLWYDRTRGLGFIAPDQQSAPDLFVYFTYIEDVPSKRFLVRGQRVSYIVNQYKGRDVAAFVMKLDEPIVPSHDHPTTTNGNTPVFPGKAGKNAELPTVVPITKEPVKRGGGQ